MVLQVVFDLDAAVGLTASWEIHSGDMVVHAIVSDGEHQAGIGPAPDEGPTPR
jgi:hypothetical protein